MRMWYSRQGYSNIPRINNTAMVKYMINPVTSTKVATKGADDVAGSAPSFFSSNGSIEPDNDPHKTIPIRDAPTVKPTSIQCGP